MNKLDIYRSMGGIVRPLNLDDVLACNEESKKYGLYFTVEEAEGLIQARSLAIRNNGRVELGIDAVKKIISAFCRSSYINRDDYAETINELVEIFYSMKNETEDLIGDDELINMMQEYYNGSCKGSLDLLRNREMAIFARYFRMMMEEQKYKYVSQQKGKYYEI